MEFAYTGIEDLLLGVLIGSTVVGASVYRTLSVHEGSPLKTFVSSIANGVAYLASMVFIVDGNMTAYVGTMIGSTALVCWMAYLNSLEKK